VDNYAARDVVHAVSELVTNAVPNVVRHARGTTWVLSLDAHSDAIEVAVLGSDPARRPGNAQDGEFGWPMVRRLATAVTVVRFPGGKAVCALMPR
jgi:anti-sigma regulatory factor (Ser/Thr protein kinase)